MRLAFSILVAALCLLSIPAQASRSEPRFDRHNPIGVYSTQPQQVAGLKQTRRKYQRRYQHRDKVPRHYAGRKHNRVEGREVQLLPHPIGCPSRSFCGCAAALEVFGRHVRELWLARNWFAFPRATPAPGMVAVRRHHVFVIRKVLGPSLVEAYDANSGQRKTRIWIRSLAGYSVRNPHGTKYASVR